MLGTSLELQVVAARGGAGREAERAALAEIDRLEAIFSAYLPTSELSRWQATRGEAVAVSPELAGVLAAAEEWRERTANAFNPAVEAVTRLWRESEARGTPPAEALLRGVAEEAARPLWSVDRAGGRATRLTALPVTLNAIAKGYVIDAACAAAAAVPGVSETLVNLGGDLRHLGQRPLAVGVADPFAGAENAEPIARATIRGEALATSGSYRRGFRVGERWHSHLIDPRTGRPADRAVSVSVIAPTALEADAAATALGVLDPLEAVALADSLPGVACFLVADDGTRAQNSRWKLHAE